MSTCEPTKKAALHRLGTGRPKVAEITFCVPLMLF